MEKITCSKNVFDLVGRYHQNHDAGIISAVMLNSQYEVIDTDHTVGDLLSDYHSPVVKAIDNPDCRSVILVYDTARNTPEPTSKEIESVAGITNMLRSVQMSLTDVVVIGNGCWFSFSDERTYKVQN